MRVLWIESVESRLFTGGNGAFFVFEDEVGTADDDALIVDLTGDAVCDEIIDAGMHLFVLERFAVSGAHDGVCHRMRKVLFEAGGNAQHFVFFVVSK